MTRVMHPPRSQFSTLREPLMPGELALVNLLDQKLSPEWEIYIQPHLNGLRPDVVVLNPQVGIGVFEVKDWRLADVRYAPKGSGQDLHLTVTDRHDVEKVITDPVAKIRLYQEEIASLYCPHLKGEKSISVVTAGLVFAAASRREAQRLLRPFVERCKGASEYPRYFPISGKDDLESGNLDALFPESDRVRSKFMSPAVAEDLRAWLREPDHSRQTREPISLDPRQRELVQNTEQVALRRVRGPAGSGKSLVLAARAARLAEAGKRVLIVTFNITLKNYLKHLVLRATQPGSRLIDSVDYLHFHSWCRRVCTSGSASEKYAALWKGRGDSDADDVLNESLAQLVSETLAADTSGQIERYDAILVDEGQDYRLSWWNALRRALRPGGEMMLVADKTQDLYATASAWTDEAMTGAGFRGRWIELKTSYRLPASLVPLAREFIGLHMAGKDTDLPEARSRELQLEFSDDQTRLRWVQVARGGELARACAAEVPVTMSRLTQTSAASDIVVLVPSQALGVTVVKAIEALCEGVRVQHTFHDDGRESRKKKLAFHMDVGKVKATTLHSYKGWENRHVIVVIEEETRADTPALLYTAMTRLRADPAGCTLTVVSAAREYRAFGTSWPEYMTVGSALT